MTQPTFQAPPEPAEPQGGSVQSGAEAPPWGDPTQFDPEKAWNLIQGLRADKEKLAARPVLDEAAQAKLAEYDQLKAASQTDLEKAQAELTRWQTDAERWRGAAVGSTVRALAATEFADPDDAVRNLDASKYLDASGVIDEKAIKADLDALLAAKPHYRREEAASGPRAPKPNPAQGTGSGKTSNDPAQEFGAILQTALTR